MTERLFNETINGASLSQIHNAAFGSLLRAYHSDGSVYMSWEDLDEIAWYATTAVYEKRDSYVKKDKIVIVVIPDPTEPPATEAPTEPPATQPPATQPPATEPPAVPESGSEEE